MNYLVNPLCVEQILSYWKGSPRKDAYEMIRKYGLPNEVTMKKLIWYNNGIWKRTILYQNTVPHNFPTPHEDYLEQVIDYKVPDEFFTLLGEFDGSVYVDRTRGEAKAKCHDEAMNTLSLNLLNDIVTRKRTVEDARLFYAETAKNYKFHNISTPYTERFLFPPQTNTADPDISYF